MARLTGWNLLLGIVAVLVSVGMGLVCVLALAENMFLLANLDDTSLARDTGQYIILGASVIYAALFAAQVTATVRLFRRRRDRGLYVPALVVTVINLSMTVLLPFALFVA